MASFFGQVILVKRLREWDVERVQRTVLMSDDRSRGSSDWSRCAVPRLDSGKTEVTALIQSAECLTRRLPTREVALLVSAPYDGSE